MLNMAPDKAADETISFQCYPLPAALLYTGRPALTAVPSFFLSSRISSSLFLSFYPFARVPLSSYHPSPLPKIYLARRSSSYLHLPSVLAFTSVRPNTP